MTPTLLAIFLVAVGVILLIAELALPTHGIVGAAGLLCFVAAIGVCFYISRYLGAVAFLGAIIATPFVFTWVMNYWAQTPVGRKFVLQETQTPPPRPHIQLGQVGVAVSQLRPMGECEFGELRIECRCEIGVIEPGSGVKVVALNDLPVVRAMAADKTNSTMSAQASPGQG